MYKFRPGAGAIVAADTQNAMTSIDDALLHGLRMFTTVVESAKGSDLPAVQSQKLFAGINSGLSQVIAGRADFVASIRQLLHIKGESDFAPEDYGCPAGWVAAASSAPADPALSRAD